MNTYDILHPAMAEAGGILSVFIDKKTRQVTGLALANDLDTYTAVSELFADHTHNLPRFHEAQQHHPSTFLLNAKTGDSRMAVGISFNTPLTLKDFLAKLADKPHLLEPLLQQETDTIQENRGRVTEAMQCEQRLAENAPLRVYRLY